MPQNPSRPRRAHKFSRRSAVGVAEDDGVDAEDNALADEEVVVVVQREQRPSEKWLVLDRAVGGEIDAFTSVVGSRGADDARVLDAAEQSLDAVGPRSETKEAATMTGPECHYRPIHVAGATWLPPDP